MRLAAAFVFPMLLGSAVGGAAAPPHSPVQWHIKNAPTKPWRLGAKFDLTLAGQIEPGWHVYALEEPEGGPLATTVSLSEGDPADVDRVTEAKPKVALDPAFGKPTGLFEGGVEFTLHGQVARDAAPGAHSLHVLVRFQTCSGSLCLPPHTDVVEVPITLAR